MYTYCITIQSPLLQAAVRHFRHPQMDLQLSPRLAPHVANGRLDLEVLSGEMTGITLQ
jgi:hypothetical protein